MKPLGSSSPCPSWTLRAARLACAFGLVLPAFAQTTASVDTPPTPGSPSENEAIVKMDVFNVGATVGQSYGASNMASATRMNTPIENIPQTISVVNSNLLRDIDSFSFDQAVRYTPGVTQRQNTPDGAIVRGLASTFNHYEDGYLAPSIMADMAYIDRIEIIKGPSASIAGASESTGLINYITKKPLFTDQSSASVTIGSWNSIRGVIDTTGPVPGFEQVAYRVVATYMNADSYRDNEHTRKSSVYPSFLWKISPNDTLSVKGEFVDNNIPAGFGTPYLAPTFGATATPIAVPANAKIQLGQWGPVAFNSSGFAGMTWHDVEDGVTIVYTHQFADWLSFRQSAMYYSYLNDRYDSALSDNFTYDANGYLFGTFQPTRGISNTNSWRFQGDAALNKTFLNDNISLRGLVGYEIARSKTAAQTFATANSLNPINIVAPDYSADVEVNLNKRVDSRRAGGSFGTFGNGQLGFFKDFVILTGGVRQDENKATWTFNNLNGAVTNTPTTPVITSPLAGLTIKPLSWISLFAVYSDAGAAATTISTYPGIPTSDPRQILVSITPDTTNKEFGAKFTFFHDNLAIDISHFDTIQNNISRNQTDPSFPGGSENFIDAGDVTKGIEVDWAGDLTKQISIYGGYVNDMTQAPGTKPFGGVLELRGTPRDKVQTFIRYELARTRRGAIAVFGGVVHQTAVYGRASDTYILPGATRYDLGFDYNHGPWTFAAGVVNLSNVIFPAFAVGQGSNSVDDPRNFYFRAALKF